MREGRRLDVVLHSATGLKKVSTSARMVVYVVAWIEPSVRVPSPADVKAHGTNPVWNTTVSLALEERTMAHQHGMYLNIELLGHGLVSTRRIGFVSVDMTDIFHEGSKGAAVHSHFLAHPVTRKSGREQGLLTFDIHLHECPNLLAVQEMIPKDGLTSTSIPRSITVAPMASTSPRGPLPFQVEEVVFPGSSARASKSDHPKIRSGGAHTEVYGLSKPKSLSSLLSCH